MNRAKTLLVVLVSTAVAVVAFAILRPNEGGDRQPAGSESAPALQESRDSGPKKRALREQRGAPRQKKRTTIVVRDGKPVGGPVSIAARKDEPVRFEVLSDVADEAHLHGYDISRSAGPGKRARFAFKARIDGIFELELEQRATQIASLKVEP